MNIALSPEESHALAMHIQKIKEKLKSYSK
jgi:hypothetical protein